MCDILYIFLTSWSKKCLILSNWLNVCTMINIRTCACEIQVRFYSKVRPSVLCLPVVFYLWRSSIELWWFWWVYQFLSYCNEYRFCFVCVYQTSFIVAPFQYVLNFSLQYWLYIRTDVVNSVYSAESAI